jgi:hypothetical protein
MFISSIATRIGPDCNINPAHQIAFYDPGLGSDEIKAQYGDNY